jgi:hypothetical protein
MTSISRRTRSISTKVTDEEYTQIIAGAKPKTVSEWARPILVRASEPVDLEFLLLAEFLALRTIVLNLHFALVEGGPVPTMEATRRLIDRADGEKLDRAHRHVAELKAAGNVTSRSTTDDNRG